MNSSGCNNNILTSYNEINFVYRQNGIQQLILIRELLLASLCIFRAPFKFLLLPFCYLSSRRYKNEKFEKKKKEKETPPNINFSRFYFVCYISCELS
jgi:hypothetical protein